MSLTKSGRLFKLPPGAGLAYGGENRFVNVIVVSYSLRKAKGRTAAPAFYPSTAILTLKAYQIAVGIHPK